MKRGLFSELFVLLGRQFAHDFLDQVQLVDLGLAGEEGVAVGDFAHDAADGPHVDFFGVVDAQKQLWRSIPSCCNVIC